MKRTLTTLLAASAVAMFSGVAIADGMYGSNYGDHPMMWGNWFMGPLMMLVIVVVIVVAVIIILKAFGAGGSSTANKAGERDNALVILNERFAKGEIDKEEYEMRKKSLTA